MKGIKNILIIALSVSFMFFVGCGKASTSSNAKDNSSENKISISRNFEDLVLGMTETEFKNKLQFYDMGERSGRIKLYIVYARPYVLSQQIPMRQIENVNKVFCYFFKDSLFQFSIYYFCNYKFSPTWENFIYNAKEKYGKGKELPVSHQIEWDDGKTTLTIEEEFESSDIIAGVTDHYYIVTYLDDAIGRQVNKKERDQGPQF